MADQKRAFEGVWIEKDIYLATELSWTEKILLVEIRSLSETEKGCFASNKYFAGFLEKSLSTVSNAISKLKRLGLVYEQSFDGRQRTLGVNREAIKKLRGRVLKTKRQHMRKQNNNIINTDISTKNKLPSKEGNITSCQTTSYQTTPRDVSARRQPPVPAVPVKKPLKKAHELFSYWNSLGIVVHKTNTVTHRNALLAASDMIKKHGYDAVCVAIDNYRSLLDAGGYYNRKYSMAEFLNPKRPGSKSLLKACLDGSVFNNSKFIGKKNGNGGAKESVSVKKKVADPHPELTRLLAETFTREVYGGAGPAKLNCQTKDYIHFMDGANIIYCIKDRDAYATPEKKLAQRIVKSLVNFVKVSKEQDTGFLKDGMVWPAYLSSEYFVRNVILRNICEYYGSDRIDARDIVPGKFKREYILNG